MKLKPLAKMLAIAVLAIGGVGTTALVAGAASATGAGGNNPVGLAAGGCVAEPALRGAAQSPLYTVTADGAPLFVEKLTKYAPEMQVHYAHCSLAGAGTAKFSVTVAQSFSSYTVSPKSRNLAVARSGNTITFDSGPNYLIVQFDSAELLFILIDAPESGAPQPGDANVKNLADYGVDNTGGTLVTSKIQSAINAASGATQNILYVPPGRYQVGELWMRSNMTLYLAAGAVLYGSNKPADFNTGSGGVNIEGMQHASIRMLNISNAKLLGRGVIDGNGKSLRAQGSNLAVLKIEQSSNILVDGPTSRDASYWNTLVYRSDKVTIRNYKVINCRPNSGYNNTDGVDFDESTNSLLSNAFLYTGDDNMATKNEDATAGALNTRNVVHENVVCYSNSGCAKIGTKTEGNSMDGVVFRGIDVVKAGRAMVIDAVDTAVVSNTRWENVRVEKTDSLIDLEEDRPPSWRTVKNTSTIRDAYFTNVSSDVNKVVNLHGKSSTVNINGVHFTNFTVQGKPVTSRTDADATWNINSYVSNITFATAPTSQPPSSPPPSSQPPSSPPPSSAPPSSEPPVPAGGCAVGYTMNAWNDGFTAAIHITNGGTAPVNGWALTFTLPSGQTITSGWNATYSGSTGQISARNVTYNATLPAGGSTDIGFQATHTGNTGTPSSFALNGVTCTVS
ncbi:cellulose binding domain-containing protein [Dactylosporangium aurantiacum]|uniref:cellulose binding domain-containing protein n=2 Tax=Dactylosporangium aurantiacum TaxID=35754 RepID=UPI0021B2C692|nr:cellulose binding domain-containing protein [Dactylosporangium aurantiacum]